MPKKVRIPTPLRKLTRGAEEVSATGKTIGELIADLERNYPGLKERICEGSDDQLIGNVPSSKVYGSVRRNRLCMILSAVALLKEPIGPKDEDIRGAMAGNICRCGAYSNIVAAVRQVRNQA